MTIEPIQQFDKKNLRAIGSYLFYQRINPDHYMITPGSRMAKEFIEAMDAELKFTTKEQYFVWVEKWVVLYHKMTEDARGEEFHWSREQRNAMMYLRAEGKKKSWAMKLARLANS